MTRLLSFTNLLLWSALLFAGSATTAQAQWDPWLMGPRYQTSYYAPSFFGGYRAGYASDYAAGYGPSPACGCPCPSACDPCGGGNSCGPGGCASGNCSLNSAPAGPMRPIPNSDTGTYGKDTPVPGRGGSSGGSRTFDEADPRRFEEPNINSGRPGAGTGSGTGAGTGTGPDTNPRKPPFCSGRTTTPADDGFGPRPGETTPTKDPFNANKPELNDPVLPDVPGKTPAAPADVKEETPLDAALDLDTKITSGPVLMRDRFVARSRSAAPSVARTPSRPTRDWSAAPVAARVVR